MGERRETGGSVGRRTGRVLGATTGSDGDDSERVSATGLHTNGGPAMNGAQSLVGTLVDQGVDICFANTGTSETHFLAALENPRMRGVLCLFEGVATGAADGWYRMKDMPASTLLHLGPGLANGLANIHNAR